MSQLPKGWVGCKLGNIVDYGKTVKADMTNIDDETWVLELEDLEKDSSKILQRVSFGERKPKSAKNAFKAGDVLYGKLRPYLNKMVVAPEDGICTSEIIPLKVPTGLVDNRFLFYWLKGRIFGDYVNAVSYGVNMPRLGTKDGLNAPMVLAPTAEQTRIVEKLDEVLAQVDTIKARLDGIPAILKRFRQSVLAAAVSGKLTEDNNSDWTSYFLSDVSTFQNGYAFKSGWFSDEGDYQVIKLGNVKDDFLKLDAAPAYLSSKLGLEHIKFKPEVGDILLSMTGTKFKRDYGFCCMVDSELPILINQRVGRIMPKRDKVAPDFLHLFLRSEVFRNQFFAGETGGVNQGNVGSKHIMATQLFVPDLALQIEIAKKARLLFTFADTIEAQVKKAQARVDKLTQSILAKAFRGELVPQDPNDEPADKLLERIAAARKEAEALAKAAKKVGRKTAKA
ncbi:restriction endonuclease subunit S [Vibrio cholerae]|uniref:restriction endonuclease subunit S n=2 Tax=Vibrio cholerae TaxID=666 RepID=UPI0022AFDEBB|nr:restriction endonuclease subunit S [Vibrio cholerae]EJL6407449.1 restriction endonuclease subunit S [Vibrio cholerae]EJL6707368.1 restriction endonuclease subunit S [Vibrio cholerae]EJL9426492.1 restriction endonuclease subunit S [Vibrio cholerae]EKF9878250.1 restriction endonuclease subunit S [Vibrio cholerae]